MVFVNFPSRRKFCFFNSDKCFTSFELREIISNYLSYDDFILYFNGRKLDNSTPIQKDDHVHVVFTLPGGKGGFGSMLRAIGAQIEKTTNREACRDLSGRRLRDINEEQRLKKWLEKESDRKADKVRRRRERIERLKTKPKHNFVDFDYEKEISALPERIDEAVTEGLQKAAKRPLDDHIASSSKKKSFWLSDELSDSSDSEKDKLVAMEDSSQGSSTVSDGEETPKSTKCEVAISYASSSPSTEHTSEENGDDVDENTKLGKESHQDTECNSVDSMLESEKEEKLSDAFKKENQDIVIDEVYEMIDLLAYESPIELESLGLEQLKKELTERGLKCGGALKDRAHRLWAVRGLSPEKFPANLRAKK